MNIPLTPLKVGVMQSTTFSHIPDEAMLDWLAKACYYWNIILLYQKIELTNVHFYCKVQLKLPVEASAILS